MSKKACLNKSLQKPSSRKQQLPDCISTESSSAEARLKNFTGDSRYDFCCCAVSSTHCYLQCLLRALSWVVAHPDTSATHRSSESSSSSSSSSVVTSVYNGCCQFVSIVRVASTALPLCVATLSSCTACPEPLESVWVVCVCSTHRCFCNTLSGKVDHPR